MHSESNQPDPSKQSSQSEQQPEHADRAEVQTSQQLDSQSTPSEPVAHTSNHDNNEEEAIAADVNNSSDLPESSEQSEQSELTSQSEALSPTVANMDQPLEPSDQQVEKLPKRRKISAWRLWAPLGLQSLLILSVLVAPVQTHLTGKTAVLRTQPIDPYDLLRGYSQTLSYDISNLDNLQKLPGWETIPKRRDRSPGLEPVFYGDTSFYLVLQAPDNSYSNQAPNPWQPIRISKDLPTDLASNQVAIKGKFEWSGATYGLERYYMPEARRDEINDAVQIANRNQTGAVEIKVRQDGYAVPVKLWVGQEAFEF
jgi:uncharacterized membrane-anchored protein